MASIISEKKAEIISDAKPNIIIKEEISKISPQTESLLSMAVIIGGIAAVIYFYNQKK